MSAILNVEAVRAALLAWYDEHRRDLPWRYSPGETPDPYRVWLSEVMLQQTRVETVKPYFRRWLERFPTLPLLAESSLDEVLKAWEGLGYYSRARNFHAAVREVAREYGGSVPSDPEAFRGLPGVGEYTAGAVMSIAFGRPAPAVDGNVKRVFARLLDEPAPSAKELRVTAERLAEGERPGDLNQAIMELGAMVCTPRNPTCGACPVSRLCASRAAGTQALRPAHRPRKALPVEEYGVAVAEVVGRFLLVRRPHDGRLGGLWEFPARLRGPDEEMSTAALRAVRDACGLEVSGATDLGVVRHDFSHVRVRYHVIAVSATNPTSRPPEDADPRCARWLRLEELDSVTLPAAQKKIARIVARYATPASSS